MLLIPLSEKAKAKKKKKLENNETILLTLKTIPL